MQDVDLEPISCKLLEIDGTSSHASRNTCNSERSRVQFPFRALVSYPRSSLLVVFLVQLSFWVVSICLAITGYDILPLKINVLPLSNPDSVWYQRNMAAVSAELNRGLPKTTNSDWNYGDYSSWFILHRIDLLYKTNEDILTTDKLNAIQRFEEKLLANKKLHKFYHFVSLFKLVPAGTDYHFDKHTFTLLLREGLKDKTTSRKIRSFFPRNFTLNEKMDFAVSPMLRSSLIPKSYQRYELGEGKRFTLGPLLSFLKEFGKKGSIGSDITFAYWSIDLYQQEVIDQVMKDGVLAVGSLLFIFLVLLLHTRSVVLTSAALFGILTALTMGNLVYRYVIGHRYIGTFHSISIFLLLGIGADDIFVIFDAWHDSFHIEHRTEAHRLSWVLHRAGGATFITTLTTAIAFLVNSSCNVPLVSTFGTFTGIAVMSNYLIAVTFIPCVLLNLHNAYGQSESVLCSPKWKKRAPRRMAKVFENIVLPFFRIRIVSMACLVICAALSCIFIWQATLLVPASSMLIQMFLTGSNYDRAEILESEMSSYRPTKVSIIFGAGMQDRSTCGKDNFTCRGTPTWIEDLDISDSKSQIALLKLCRRLRTDPEWKQKLHLIADPENQKQNYVQCFFEDFEREALLPALQRCPSNASGPPLDLRVPLNRKKIERLAECYPEYFEAGRTTISQNFSRFYETGLSIWLQGKTPLSSYGTTHVAMTYEGGDPDLRMISGRLRLAVITTYTDLSFTSGSFHGGLEIRNNWETIIGSEISKLPTAALRKGFQCTPDIPDMAIINFWEWFEIQESLWNNALTGLLSGLFAVALPILLVATRNVVLSLAGITCLAFATGGVISMANAFGWPLGVTESINMAIITGLSVDYVVHFIEAYHQASSECKGRDERVKKMLVQAGGAVSSGVITTLGAIAFLLGSELRNFVQFAVFLGSTIFFAFFSSIFLLTPLLILLGPQHSFGSLDPYIVTAWRKLKRICRRI